MQPDSLDNDELEDVNDILTSLYRYRYTFDLGDEAEVIARLVLTLNDARPAVLREALTIPTDG